MLAAVSFPAGAAPAVPAKLFDCVHTRIAKIETRLYDGKTNTPVPGSGSAVSFTNGLYQVSYDQIPAIDKASAGDPIFICLVELPKDCPPGDNRGKVYTATDLLTEQSWTLADSEHMCGGA
jgi:hypothetical protein